MVALPQPDYQRKRPHRGHKDSLIEVASPCLCRAVRSTVGSRKSVPGAGNDYFAEYLALAE